MAQCKTALTPLQTHWSYCSLAPNHRYTRFTLCLWCVMVCQWSILSIEGILPKGSYLPCVSMAGRALLAGYPRHIVQGHFTGTGAISLKRKCLHFDEIDFIKLKSFQLKRIVSIRSPQCPWSSSDRHKNMHPVDNQELTFCCSIAASPMCIKRQ